VQRFRLHDFSNGLLALFAKLYEERFTMTGVFDQGYLALPATEKPAPAIMVIPAWWGLNAFFKQFCDRLAESGFVAFAPDLYGGKVAENIEQAKSFRDGLNSGKTKKLLRGSVEALRQHPHANGQPISLIGFL